MPRLFASLTLLALLSACSGVNSPTASRLSAQNTRFTSQTGVSSQSQLGSRLSARQTDMQAAEDDFEDPEAQAAQDALIDAGSEADLEARAERDRLPGGSCAGDYNEHLACQGASN